MIGIVGDLEDLSARYLGWLAERRGIDVLMLPEEQLGLEWWFRLPASGSVTFTVGGRDIPLSEIEGAVVRLNPKPSVDGRFGLDPETEPVYALERRHGLNWLLNTAPINVVNRPASGRSNGSKAFQMAVLADAGLVAPEWVVTTRAQTARDVADAWPEGAIYKAVSGLRSHVWRVDETMLERMASGTTPVIIQRYVPGVDVRVHTIGGGAVFATEISSTAVDYRFAETSPEYRAVEVPPAIARRCLDAASNEGLALAGFDFRRDPQGRWWCLEMNPVPTFLPYEAATGHPIGDAVLDYVLGRVPRAEGTSPLATAFEPAMQPVTAPLPARSHAGAQ